MCCRFIISNGVFLLFSKALFMFSIIFFSLKSKLLYKKLPQRVFIKTSYHKNPTTAPDRKQQFCDLR